MKSFDARATLGAVFIAIMACLQGCSDGDPTYDLLIKNARICDGSGGPCYMGAVAVRADTIADVGAEVSGTADQVINARGHVVSPGFINMLSWATISLLEDGRGMSDIKQGVTLEVMGEGTSMGPLNDDMIRQMQSNQGDVKFQVKWRSLGEYLTHLEQRGVSPNVASFVGATTVRIHELGYEDRAPDAEELERMKSLVAEAMDEGALGLGSSLIYTPAFFAETEELIELSKVVAQYGGLYITHMRSEGNLLLEGVEEVLRIGREAGVRAEIYHLKAGGEKNWPKMDQVIARIHHARERGVPISANMYTYTAGATGLDAAMPPWVQEGGYDKWAERLHDPEIRQRVALEMKTDAQDWENLYHAAGSADKLILVGFKNEALKKHTGKTLAAVAAEMGKSPEETAMDLVIQDGSRVGTVYFLMSEENVRKQLRLPYITFGSDAAALATEGVFLKSSTHPRAYGNFARVLGKYVREEQVLPMEEAIHKLTYLAAQRLRIPRRGLLAPGYYADLVVFDAETIADHATFEEPHQYATGVNHVFVNGTQVLKDGEHTGATPGRFVKGPGYRKGQ